MTRARYAMFEVDNVLESEQFLRVLCPTSPAPHHQHGSGACCPACCKPARANIPKDAHRSACFSMSKLALLQESNMLNYCRRKSLQVALFIGQAAAKTVGPLYAKAIGFTNHKRFSFTALCAGSYSRPRCRTLVAAARLSPRTITAG